MYPIPNAGPEAATVLAVLAVLAYEALGSLRDVGGGGGVGVGAKQM